MIYEMESDIVLDFFCCHLNILSFAPFYLDYRPHVIVYVVISY